MNDRPNEGLKLSLADLLAGSVTFELQLKRTRRVSTQLQREGRLFQGFCLHDSLRVPGG